MSTPFRLPKLVGRKHVVVSAVQEIPQFECNKLHVEKHIGRGSFGEVFLTEFRNTDKEPAEKVVVNGSKSRKPDPSALEDNVL